MGRLKQHPGDWQETEMQCRSASGWSLELQSREKLVRERGTCYGREIKDIKAWFLIMILKLSYHVHFWHIIKHPICKNSLKQAPNSPDCLPLHMHIQQCVSELPYPDQCSDTPPLLANPWQQLNLSLVHTDTQCMPDLLLLFSTC